MPLPKMPTKPAALLSPVDYPKAEKNNSLKKPVIALVEAPIKSSAPVPVARTKSDSDQREERSGNSRSQRWCN
jgi:PhoH-like ATPase